MGKAITVENGKLNVPDNPVIPFIEGDGIGHEIWCVTRWVVDKAVEKVYNSSRKIEWKEVLAGDKAYEQTGNWLPQETIDAFKQNKVGIKGPLTTPVGGGIRSINVDLRQILDLYVCLRPVRYFKGVPSPHRSPESVNITVFRENTEDFYSGIECIAGSTESEKFRLFLENDLNIDRIRFPNTSAYGVKVISKEGSERLVRAAIKYAIKHQLPSVTLVHKGNIMKFTEGAFKKWGYELAEREFKEQVFTWERYELLLKDQGKGKAKCELRKAKEKGKIIIKDMIMDAFLQDTILNPQNHSVIATMNVNGDYISDQVAALVGGVGMAPGANINYKEGYAIFEATHGTAPAIQGTGQANPSSLLLSAVMMLKYIGWKEVAEKITQTLEKTYEKKTVTADLYPYLQKATLLSTNEFGTAIINNL